MKKQQMKESLVKEPSLRTERSDILERTFDFSVRVIKFYQKMEKEEVNKILGRQLLRAATSVGANVHEAQGGQSKAILSLKFRLLKRSVLKAFIGCDFVKKLFLSQMGKCSACLMKRVNGQRFYPLF